MDYHDRINNNQLKLEVNFKNGIRNGLWKEYHENGQLYGKGRFFNGEMIIQECFNKDGEKKINGTQYDSYSELDKFNEQDYLSLMKICKKYRTTRWQKTTFP